MSFKQVMSFEEANDLFIYDADTGKIFWRVKTARKVIPGMEAGSLKGTRKNASGETVSYKYISVNGKSVPAARVAWLLHYGEWPQGRIMFRNNDTFDLRSDNLFMTNSMETSHTLTEDGARADYLRDHRQAFPLSWKDTDLRRRFGIGLNEYMEMVAQQGNRCAICKQAETETRSENVKMLAVDHCHKTNTVRGLLCTACNTGIGKLGDDPAVLRAAADYIERHAQKPSNVVLLKKDTL